MTWRRADDKPLPEAILTQFTDEHMQHSGNMSHVYPVQAIYIHDINPKYSLHLYSSNISMDLYDTGQQSTSTIYQ